MVSSYLTLIERRYGPQLDEDGREFLRFARDGATQMDRLTLDLLEYSRVGRGEMAAEPVDLAVVAAAARRGLEALIAEQGCSVIIETAAAPMTGQPTELMRLFQNLMANAIKYHATERVPSVEVGWRDDGGTWLAWVRDNGIGIPPDQRDAVFGVFKRLHSTEDYEGSGIGLAICKKIVERHGGRIWIDPGTSAGTTILMSLPQFATG